MTFTFACLSCGHPNRAELASCGRTSTCPACGRPNVIPAPMEPAAGPGQGGASGPLRALPGMKFACPNCGRKFVSKPELVGKKIRCCGCGAGVRVPGEAAPAANPRPASGAHLRPADPPGGSDSAIELELVEAVGPSSPGSGRRRSADRVATVLPSRTQAMEEARQRLAEQAEAREKAKQAKRKARRGVKAAMNKRLMGTLEIGDLVNILIGTGGAAVVLGGLAWAYPGLRFPIGGLLCLVGFLAYAMGTVGFSQAARDEGGFHSLGCRFVPLYKWYFLVTRWSLVKDYCAFLVVGLAVMGTGGALIKTSPVGIRAEASERALQALTRDEPPPPAVPGAPAPAPAPAPDDDGE